MMKIGCLFLSIGIAVPASADRLSEVLEAMEKAGNELQTLSAEFEQTDHDYILEDEDVSSGKLFVEIPGRIRWEYAPPAEKVLLVKDDLVRVYNPVAAQVQEFDRSSGGSTGGMDLLVGFGSGNDDIQQKYDGSVLDETPDHVVLKLIPKPESGSLFTAIELTVDKKSWTPTRTVLHEPSRNRTDISFREMVINGELPGSVFELELPENVEIIRD